jgi:hypothetical protein
MVSSFIQIRGPFRINRQALELAQVAGPLREHRLIPLWPLAEEGIRVGDFRRAMDLVVAP